MRLAARACAPLASTARCQVVNRGIRAHLLCGKFSSNVPGGLKGMHLLSRRGALCEFTGASATRPELLDESLKALCGQSQSRSFRKANYADKVHDNEKTEEVLEALEVRDDEKDTRPQRQVLNAKGEKPSSGQRGSGWPDEMTKGEWLFSVQRF